jgi:excisionase family DNA binding protein
MNDLQTAEQLAPSLGVSPRMLLRLAQRAEIPFYRIGRLIRFDPNAVREALARGRKAGA